MDDAVQKETEEAIVALRNGDYRQGWRLWESRASRVRGPFMRCGLPEWTGQDLRGVRLLVAGEQGIGDEVQFGRFIPRLKELGAHVIAAVLPMNQRLFRQFGADEVLDRLAPNSLRADYVVGLLSLPLRFNLFDEADFGTAPYLEPRATGGDEVGIVWHGQRAHWNDRYRSMSGPDLLLTLPNARLIEPSGDTVESLGILSGLRALVSVDTSWVHMAGAIGLDCHVLLSCVSTDWRWGIGRVDSCWYRSLSLYRQRKPDDWEPLVTEIRERLATQQSNDHPPVTTRT